MKDRKKLFTFFFPLVVSLLKGGREIRCECRVDISERLFGISGVYFKQTCTTVIPGVYEGQLC